MVSLVILLAFALARHAAQVPNGAAIDAEVRAILSRTRANGLAIAVVDHGKVGYVQPYGIRNALGDPLTIDTVMYGASLTKTVFAYTVMQLVDQGKLNLDTRPRPPCRTTAPIPFSPTNMAPTATSPAIPAGSASRRMGRSGPVAST